MKSLLHTLPNEFTLSGNTFKVEFVEKTEDNSYGYFCDATQCITLAKKVDTSTLGEVELTDVQIINTFFHELVHAFQFLYGSDYSETEAQVYANFLTEFFKQL